MADERNRMLEQLNTDDWQECRQSVLIVDDSAMNRRMLTEILGGRFDTAEATSGEECLHLLEENRDGISIVLLDIHMEGMDGFAVLEEMDRQKMLEDIPVIMISSEDKVDAMRRAFDLGASDYISRPFDARVVCQRIGNTMRLYAKQRRLCAAVEKQIREADQNSRIMLALLNRVWKSATARAGTMCGVSRSLPHCCWHSWRRKTGSTGLRALCAAASHWRRRCTISAK